jgi:Fur family ferric uptake transcriptional regulator
MSTNELKKSGLKVTIPRVSILHILEQARDLQQHISAEEVYRQLVETEHEIGLATVYRVLAQFEAAGLITKHRFEEDRAVFELTNETHHDHLVCTVCSKVIEFLDEVIEARQEKIAHQHGFSISDHSLYLYGVCPDCKS